MPQVLAFHSHLATLNSSRVLSHETVIRHAEEAVTPAAFSLGQNYPNPFNAQTAIPFSLPRDTHVELEIFDINGRRIAILLDKLMPAGYHRLVFNAGPVASGVYFCQLHYRDRGNSRRLTEKLVVVK